MEKSDGIPADNDGAFASPETSGRSPFWFDSALRGASFGRLRGEPESRRGSDGTLQEVTRYGSHRKERVHKIVQELMRHADPRIIWPGK